MHSPQSPREFIVRFLASQRVSLAVGLGVLAAAALVGILMGAPVLIGLVGVLITLAAFALITWRGRDEGQHDSGIGGTFSSFAVATVAVLVLIQLVPYGRSHSNPPVLGEPAWSSPQTRELMVNACFGCHSNEVEWPWYSNVAPISWVVASHVDEGRAEVNYSEFSVDPGEADESVEVIREGDMPPSYYTVLGLHPEARLTDAEIEELVAGLVLTPGMTEDESEDD